MDALEQLAADLAAYAPCCEQEARDRDVMLTFLRTGETPLERTNLTAHFTASGWTVSRDRTKVLMAYHNLYRSWSWTGGHADGEADLLAVALREAQEETGVAHIRPVSEMIFSVETLVVEGHEKRGEYVPCHLHMNVTYLLEADETDALAVKPDENSAVAWIPTDEVAARVTEPWMMARIYQKLLDKTPAPGDQ